MRTSLRPALLLIAAILLTLSVGYALAGDGAAQGTAVEFTGTVESINGTTAVISGQIVDASTPQLFSLLRAGQSVTVRGTLQPGGHILATQIVIIATGTLPATIVPPTTTPGPNVVYECPRVANFWETNLDAWPVDTLMLGSQSYQRGELIDIMRGRTEQDASMQLARQLIAAKLNVANGANPDPAGGVIGQADTILSYFDAKVPYNLEPSSSVGEAMTNFARALSSYNRRLLTQNCNDSVPNDETPIDDDLVADEVVIEGPVQQIDGNTIWVYGMELIVDRGNDILDDLKVGDVVRVEGIFDGNANHLVLIVMNIDFVGNDVVIIDQGNGNCQNPPPEHAPARGWRHRCENGPDPGNDDDNGMGMGDD
jgi:hypothetical protein